LHPCNCKGSTKWVHELCLQRWIDEKQNGNILHPVLCSQCNAPYRVVLPSANFAIRYLEKLDWLIGRLCPPLTAGAVLLSSYWSAVSYGYVTVLQIAGMRRGSELVERTDPLVLMIALPSIPFVLIGFQLIPYEERVLLIVDRLLRPRRLNGQSPILGRIPAERAAVQLPEEPPAAPIVPDAGGAQPAAGHVAVQHRVVNSATRTFIGALSLPTVAMLMGKALTWPIVDMPTWKRSLMGGMTFLLMKCMVKVYFRYKQLIRRRSRRILQADEQIQSGMEEIRHIPPHHHVDAAVQAGEAEMEEQSDAGSDMEGDEEEGVEILNNGQ